MQNPFIIMFKVHKYLNPHHHVLPCHLNANIKAVQAGWYTLLLLSDSSSVILSPRYSTTNSPWKIELFAKTPRPIKYNTVCHY